MGTNKPITLCHQTGGNPCEWRWSYHGQERKGLVLFTTQVHNQYGLLFYIFYPRTEDLMKLAGIFRASFVFGVAAFVIGAMVFVVVIESQKKVNKIADAFSIMGLSEQERNLLGYLKSANAHHYYDIAAQVQECQSSMKAGNITSSHLCVMPDGVTVKDTLEGRIGSGN